jgi:ATP-dependent RNA helicase DHX8/PRP22
MHASRRAHAARAFVTLAEPPQTVFPRQGNEALLDTASHVVFTELAWHGRLVMRHACAVKPEWLQPLLPRLKQPMADAAGGEGQVGEPADGGVAVAAAGETPSLVRRNDASAVAAAQQRFEERRKRLKSQKAG